MIFSDFKLSTFGGKVFSIKSVRFIRIIAVLDFPSLAVQMLTAGALYLAIDRADMNVDFSSDFFHRMAGIQKRLYFIAIHSG